MAASPVRAKVVRLGVGEGDDAEGEAELDPQAISEREATTATRAVGRCICRELECISVIPP